MANQTVADIANDLAEARVTADWYEPPAYVHRDEAIGGHVTTDARKVCIYAFDSEVDDPNALGHVVDDLPESAASVTTVVFPDELSGVIRHCPDIVVSDLEWCVNAAYDLGGDLLADVAEELEARENNAVSQ